MLAFVRARKEKNTAGAGKVSLKKIFPFFVLFFVLASVVTTLFQLPAAVTAPLKELSKFFIIMAMAAIGLNTNIVHLVRTGGQAHPAGLLLLGGHRLRQPGRAEAARALVTQALGNKTGSRWLPGFISKEFRGGFHCIRGADGL